MTQMEVLGGIQERSAEVSDRGSNFGLRGGEGRPVYMDSIYNCKISAHEVQITIGVYMMSNWCVSLHWCLQLHVLVCMHAYLDT